MDLAQISALKQDYDLMLKGLAEALTYEQLKVVVLCRMLAEQEAEHHRVMGELEMRLQEREKEVLQEAR